MKIRRIIYLAMLAFVFIYVVNFYGKDFNDFQAIPLPLEISEIMSDFVYPEEIEESSLAKQLYFPRNFTGNAGEVFYLVTDDYIYKYKLLLLVTGKKETTTYLLHDKYENLVLPADKFDIYDL